MKDNSGNRRRERAVIPAQDVFTRQRRRIRAHAEASRDLEAGRRAALERRLVSRILNRDRDKPGLHLVE